MALVERIMGLESPKISVHTFCAANDERIEGNMTRQNVIDAFALDAAAITEYDLLALLAPTGTNALQTALKSMFVSRVQSVFILAEERIAGYDTPTLVRTKLGL
jgi:hypothetical protein